MIDIASMTGADISDDTPLEKLAILAILLWGPRFQMDMAIEECSEMILAARHLDRGKATMEDFMREVADVEIMCTEMRALFCNDERYTELKAEKIAKFRAQVKQSLEKRK